MNHLGDYIAVLFTILLAGLVAALIFRRDFRNAVLGAPGEATVFGLLTVKGVAIVLLCGLLIAGILFVFTHAPAPAASQTVNPNKEVTMRLDVNFEPNEVNPRNPNFKLRAFIKTPQGNQPIPFVPKIEEGAFSIQVAVPDMETPFFVVFETPKGIWQTDDYSVTEAHAVAHKQEQ